MKSKTGYGLKKKADQIAGGPSFLIRDADDDPYLTPEERERERQIFYDKLRNTEKGREIWRRGAGLRKQIRETLKGI